MASAPANTPYTLLDSEPRQQQDVEEENEAYDVDHDDYDQSVHLATIAEKKRLWLRTVFINALFISSWFGFATLLSVYNKWMFSEDHYNFKYPLFVSAVQMFVQFALATLLRTVWPQHFRPDLRPTKEDYLKKALPTAVTTGLDIGMSNLSLRAITLSFYTMCKSSSLIFVLGFAFLFHLERFSFRLVGVIFLIFCGVLLMVATETHFALGGFILVTSASALSGLRWSLTQLLLRNKNMGMDNPPTTLFWLTPAMGITLGIVSLFVDSWSEIFRSDFFADMSTGLETSFFLIAPGVVAFLMVVSEFYVIQRAGVVPMSIAAVAKEVFTIVVAAIVFGDELTPLNITGVGVTISGICLYTYHKYRASMDSTVPLDAHGNPVCDEEDTEPASGRVALNSAFELDETEHLTRNISDGEPASRHGSNREVLFVANEDEDAYDDDETPRVGYIPPASIDLQNAWTNPPHP